MGVGVVGLYVHNQDEALAFYVEKLGFRVHTDARNGDSLHRQRGAESCSLSPEIG
jgi:catechol 2,3-dioxygenase-like lactoylglutathione lyase family enzyme